MILLNATSSNSNVSIGQLKGLEENECYLIILNYKLSQSTDRCSCAVLQFCHDIKTKPVEHLQSKGVCSTPYLSVRMLTSQCWHIFLHDSHQHFSHVTPVISFCVPLTRTKHQIKVKELEDVNNMFSFFWQC